MLRFLVFVIVVGSVICGRPRILEISTRPYLYSLSEKYGRSITKFRDIPDQEFVNLAGGNYTHVWFMGVWALGPYGLNHDRTDPNLLASYAQVLPDYTVSDIIGTPYAVVSYDVNPELGSESDLVWLRQKLRAQGLLLVLDYAPNHTAIDSPWMTSNIDYYVRAPKGTPTPYDSNVYFTNGVALGGDQWDHWSDTAQLNYWNMDLKKVRIAELKKVASLADAIRCDMAMLILNDCIEKDWSTQLSSWGYKRPSTEFWADAISSVKASYPNTIFIAEAYWDMDEILMANGFDFIYGKDLLDDLASWDLSSIWSYIKNRSDKFSKTLSFIENHDEPRAVAKFGDWVKADSAAIVAFTLPGAKLLFDGETYGYKNKLDVHLRRAKSESKISQVTDFYDQLLDIISQDVFAKGDWTLIEGNTNKGQVVSWRYSLFTKSGTSKRLVVVNFTEVKAAADVVVADAVGKNGGDSIDIKELFSGAVYTRSASTMKTKGLTIVLDPWRGQIFEY